MKFLLVLLLSGCAFGKTLSTLRIGGKVYHGNNISVINGDVLVDGKKVNGVEIGEDKVLKIKVEGGLASLSSDSAVECQDVAGDVHSTGSVTARDIKGKVDAMGSVNAAKITGPVEAMGSVNCGR